MSQKKIVVVDDDPDMRALVETVLKDTYEVVTAPDGVAGLEAVKREKPDLVVLDLLMPGMHGFEVCKRIRADPALVGVKVLISSSKSYAHDKETAGEAGADLYLVKPWGAVELKKRVQELLGQGGAVSVRFWGTRGSIATPGPETQRYGGNTPCTEIRVGEDLFILDAGTGLRALGNELLAKGAPVQAHLLIGHTHWDHIQGLPFFTPAYLPQTKLSIYGVHGTTQSFADVLGGQMSPAYFPVRMKELPSKTQVNELSGPLKVGDATITYHYLNHPGITVGFRFQTPRGVICYLSDHETYSRLNNKGAFSAKEDHDVASFVAGADLLICEAQYTEEEYKTKRSWGHSTFQDVLGLAALSETKKLALFHHDPSHTDEMMDKFAADCRVQAERGSRPVECFAAQEGQRLSL